jgi:hypothetical protein
LASFLPLGRTLTAPASESNCCQRALMMELMIAASFGYDSGQSFTVCFRVLGGEAERSVSAPDIVFSKIPMRLPHQYSAFLRVNCIENG